MLKTFIDRPVLSTVISIIFVVLGIIGVITLPVEQYPDIAPPTVVVSATYPGANADVIMNSVVVPLEQQINGVEGMTYMTSTSSNDGIARITIFFEQGIDANIAAVNVQNLAATATPLLPPEVVQTGVTVRKQQSSTILMIVLSSDNPDYDGRFIQNYANINIIPQIQRVKGVGSTTVYGARDYSMRVWLKPDVMASYKITPDELIAALKDQNIDAAPGQLGQNSSQTFQYTMKYTGRLKTAEEFADIIIRSQSSQVLRIKDVADVELGSLNYTVFSQINGLPAVAIGVSQIAGSNAQEVIDNIKASLSAASANFPPGLKATYITDANEFLSESIRKVIHTLVEAFILVFIVVFIFLQNIRATIIPAIAVPVAIIGTFLFLQLFGFSINLLTLFALVLAIGIVVDDAIVVVEAVHAKLDAGEKDPRVATHTAINEIAPAIISITLVMSAVFIPVSFIGGTSGIFFKQFGLTLAVAIVISAVNALTLSPALCAIFLKPHSESKSFLKRFYDNFNIGFSAMVKKYRATLNFLGRPAHRWIAFCTIGIAAAVMFFMLRMIPPGFVPQEDSGGVMGMITLPPGTSLEHTDSLVRRVVKIAYDAPHVKDVLSITGVNFMSGLGSSYASIIMKMEPWDERDITTNQMAAHMKQATDSIRDATFLFMGSPTLQGFGFSNGVTMQMQDRMGGDIQKFYGITNQFIAEMNKRKEVMMSMTTFNPNFPQKLVETDVAKIKDAGLTVQAVMGSLQAYIGSVYASNFNLYGKQFRVMVQAAPGYRSSLDDMKGIFVRTPDNEMAPVMEFLTIKDVTGPQSLSRFNMYTSMDVTIIPNFTQGYSTGDVINIVKEVSDQTLPDGYTYDYSGMSREEVKSGGQTIIVFTICLVFVYLLLSGLYESYIIPFAVILSLPVGLAGVFVFVFISLLNGSGIVNNIYVQIAMIMLIGLLSKNAILIVEYALQRRREGMGIVEAAINGATARLRPILMTSFAFIFGLLPLALATGAGAMGNRSIGISAIGGMLVGTAIGIVIIPTLYIIFQTLQDMVSKPKKMDDR